MAEQGGSDEDQIPRTPNETRLDSIVNVFTGDIHIHEAGAVEQVGQFAHSDAERLKRQLLDHADSCGDFPHPIPLECVPQVAELELSSKISASERESEGERANIRDGDIRLGDIFVRAKEKTVAASRCRCRSNVARKQFEEKHGNVVGVVGQAGIGKTFLTKIFLAQVLLGCIIPVVSFVFYIPVRRINFSDETNLIQMLVTPCLPSWRHTRSSDEDILMYMNDDPNVLIIFDGLDEVPAVSLSGSVHNVSLYDKAPALVFIKNILGGNLLPRAKKLVTCRTRQFLELESEFLPILVVEILGFSCETRDRLCREICGNEKSAFVLEVLNRNPSLTAQCHVPVNCVLIFAYMLENFERVRLSPMLPMSDVLTSTFMDFSRSAHANKSHSNLTEADFRNLSKFAWQMIREKKFLFVKTDFQAFNLDGKKLEAFLTTTITRQTNINIRIFEGEKKSYFSHLIWQEFLSAVYLMAVCSPTDFELCLPELSKGRWEVVAKFVFGLCNQITFEMLQPIFDTSATDIATKRLMLVNFLENHMHHFSTLDPSPQFLRVCSWACEANHDDIVAVVTEYMPLEIKLNGSILPTDVVALCYVMRASSRVRPRQPAFRALRSCRFVADSFERLTQEIAHSIKVTYFNLYRIGNDKARQLANCIHNISELNISQCLITEEGMRYLAQALGRMDHQIEHINLGNNYIGLEGCRHLAQCLEKVQELNLRQCQLNDECVAVLVDGTRASTMPLKLLDLSLNDITDMGARLLMPVLHKIININLAMCNISDAVALEIREKRRQVGLDEECGLVTL